MADPIDMREMFFTNLLLLGFDPTSMEAKHKIPFSRDMFALPNKKAFEVVTHYLFTRLDSNMAREAFRDCWPIYDKKGEQQFRRTVNNWMTQISREEPEANLPRVVASLFMSPGGVKRRDIQERPTVLPSDLHLTPLMLTGVQAGLVRHRKRALDTAQTAQVLEAEWKQFANPSRRKAGGRLQHDDDILRVRRTQAVHKVACPTFLISPPGLPPRCTRTMHTCLMHRHSGLGLMPATPPVSFSPQEGMTGLTPAASLRRPSPEVSTPEVVSRLASSVHRAARRTTGLLAQGTPTYDRGVLTGEQTFSFVQLSSLALHLYIEKLHEGGLPNFSDFSAGVATQVHTHHAHLSNAQAFRDTLADKVIPDLQESVARLTRELDSQYLPQEPNTRNSYPLSIPSLGLGLMPATPPVSFSPQEGTTGLTPAASLRRPSPEVSTPEVVSRLASSVHRAARRTTGLLAQGTPTYDRGVLTGEQTFRESIQPASKIPVKRKEERPVQQPRAPPSVQQEVLRAPVPTSPDTDDIFTPLKTDPKVRVERTPVHQRRRAQDMLASQSKQPMGDQRWRTPVGRPMEDPSTPSRGPQGFTPKAHQLLIDQIASAVAEERTPSVASSSDLSPPSSPVIQPLQDPLAALGKTLCTPMWKDILSQEGRKDTPTRTLFPQDNAHQEQAPIVGGLAGIPNGWPQPSKPRYPSIEDQESSESEKPSSPVGSVSTQSSLLSLLNGNDKGRENHGEGRPLEDLIAFSSAESSVPSSMNGGKAVNGLEKDGGSMFKGRSSSSSSVEEISTESMQRMPHVTMMKIVTTPLGLSDEIPSEVPIEELLGNLALDAESPLRTSDDAAPADPPIRLENVEETFNEIFSSRTPTLEVRSRLGTLHTPGNTSSHLSDSETPLWQPELFDSFEHPSSKSPDGTSAGEGKLLSDIFAGSQKRSPVVTNGSTSASEVSDSGSTGGLQRDRHPTASSGKSVTFAEVHTEHTYSAYESMNSSKGASLLDDSQSLSAPPVGKKGTAEKTDESPEDLIARYQRLKASAMALMAEEVETDPVQDTLAKLSIDTAEVGGSAEPPLSDKFLEHSPRKDEEEKEDYRRLSGLHEYVFSSPFAQPRGRLDWEDDVEPGQTTADSLTSAAVWTETWATTPNRTPVHPAVNRIRKASGTSTGDPRALANSPVTDWLHSDGRPNFLRVDDTILVPPSPLESHQYSFSDTPTSGRAATRGSPTVGHLIDF
uniref:HAUS augmin-like complex subunit 6 N-terminal domain-containing protein n=1 Tax=Branchiostoma floridae TaxID=7739 RepID=C3Y2C7_BRAFL|eukprot:XP_002610007.1 hypothetical protein BRAFLDRAFT_131115 [Branchiostoma floridae]